MILVMVEIMLVLIVLGMFVVAAACSVLLGAAACSKNRIEETNNGLFFK